MTKDEINRVIAESGLFKFPEQVPINGQWFIHKPNTPYYHEFYELLNPAERIDHAWMVVEKLETRQFVLERKYERWLCDIQDNTGKWFTVDPQDTAPMAISLAALEAVEGGENE